MGWRGLSSAAAAACLVALVTACTAGSTPEADAHASRPGPTTTSGSSPAPTLVPDAAPLGDSGPCDAATPAYPVTAENEIEQLGGVTLAVPFDRGPMPHAAGEAVLNDAGVPVAYEVAANDVFATVGARFCVGEQWLSWVNYVRRDNDTLYVGDTLNLDAHTIMSVGDQNGVVYGNVLPEGFVIPPQR